MGEIFIKKAKLIDNRHLELEYNLVQADGDYTTQHEYKILSRHIVHKDLIDAFGKLVIHLALLTEILDSQNYNYPQFEDKSIYSLPEFLKYKVTSFSIGGEGEHEGVTITGRKDLKSKKVLNLNSPFTKFSSADYDTSYDFEDLLYSHVQACITEVKLYLKGKYAPSNQLDLGL